LSNQSRDADSERRCNIEKRTQRGTFLATLIIIPKDFRQADFSAKENWPASVVEDFPEPLPRLAIRNKLIYGSLFG
jgi:hypothetical protein